MSGAGFGTWMIAVLVPAMLFASWNDYRTHRVPNWLNALVATSGLTVQAMLFGWPGVSHGLQGMAVGFGLLIVLWLMRGMGAGDVKFMAAIGAWLGPEMTLYAVAAGGIIGGILAVAMIAMRGSWRQTGTNLGVMMSKVTSVRTALSEFGSAGSLAGQSGVMPYAIPLTMGTCLTLVTKYYGWWGIV